MKLLPPPGPERRPQLIRLAVMVVVLAGLAWYRFRPADEARSTSNPQVAAPAVAALTLPQPVKLEALDAVAERSEVGRNPFAYGVRPPPPPPPAPPPPPPRPPAPPPPPPGPPPISLKLIGLTVIPGSGRTMATLEDPSTGSLLQAFEGDIVDGRYRIVKVGLQSVVVAYVDGSGMRTIPLGG